MTEVPQRRVRLVGIGAGGPDQITVEGVTALDASDYAIVARKAPDDPLVELRRSLLERHAPDLELVEVDDPVRDRSGATASAGGYESAVVDWHQARAAAYERLLLERSGDAAFLVWGDPGFYDSTIRIMDRISSRGRVRAVYDVIPGISALQVLAARHRIVLHEVGQPVHITTGRRLQEAVGTGMENIAVMLDARLDLTGLDDWTIWWGANLGTAGEQLVAGRVGDVRDQLRHHHDRLREAHGWVMDVYLLRRPAPTPLPPASRR